MRVEAKSKIKHLGTSGHHYNLNVGDTITMHAGDEPDGANWVANGWAKNADTGEDNAPSKEPATLDIHPGGVAAVST